MRSLLPVLLVAAVSACSGFVEESSTLPTTADGSAQNGGANPPADRGADAGGSSTPTDGGQVVTDGGQVPNPQPTTYRCTPTGAVATRQFPPTGVVPNDQGDDGQAIQDAIDAASAAGGGIVPLPAGRLILNDHLVLKSNVKLAGVGPETVLKAGPQFLTNTGPFDGFPIITTNGANNITLTNFTADQSGDVLNGNVDGRLNEYVVDVRFSQNAVVDGVSVRNQFTYAIAVVGSERFCVIRSNTLMAHSGRYDQLDGIHVLDSSFGEVLANTVDQRVGSDGDDGLVAHSISDPVHDVLYAGNKVRGGSNGAGMQFARGDQDIYNVQVYDNEFWGSPAGVVTGFYGGNAGVVRNVVIGGSAAHRNIFRSNDIDAVDFNGPLRDVTVSYNVACKSGQFKLGPGTNNVAVENTVSNELAACVR